MAIDLPTLIYLVSGAAIDNDRFLLARQRGLDIRVITSKIQFFFKCSDKC